MKAVAALAATFFAAVVVSGCEPDTPSAPDPARGGMAAPSVAPLPEPNFPILAGLFPEETARFQAEMVEAMRRGELGLGESDARYQAFADQLLADNVHRLAQADAAALVRLFDAQRWLLEALGRSDVAACAAFADTGALPPERVAGLPRDASAWAWEASGATLRALASAVNAPVEHSPLTPAELDAIAEAYARAGGSEAWLDAASPAEQAALGEAERCRGAQLMMQAVSEAGPDLKARYMATAIAADAPA